MLLLFYIVGNIAVSCTDIYVTAVFASGTHMIYPTRDVTLVAYIYYSYVAILVTINIITSAFLAMKLLISVLRLVCGAWSSWLHKWV